MKISEQVRYACENNLIVPSRPQSEVTGRTGHMTPTPEVTAASPSSYRHTLCNLLDLGLYTWDEEGVA